MCWSTPSAARRAQQAQHAEQARRGPSQAAAAAPACAVQRKCLSGSGSALRCRRPAVAYPGPGLQAPTGKVILEAARCCSSSLFSLLNRNTEKARCSRPRGCPSSNLQPAARGTTDVGQLAAPIPALASGPTAAVGLRHCNLSKPHTALARCAFRPCLAPRCNTQLLGARPFGCCWWTGLWLPACC